jgi:hypothetical protein
MPKRSALFIGNIEYQDATLTRLKTPGADVHSLAAVFRDPAIGEFDEVVELLDESEGTVRRAIAGFFARRHPEDLLLLYFSGHGVKDDRGRLYLAVRDTSSQQLSATGIAATYITEHMDECRSKRQILILDCCNSGAFARGTKGDATALTQDTFAGNGYGRVVLTASDATQYALEGDQVIERAELSLFTHYLLEGLTNGADCDDEVITLDALYDYAYGKVVSSTPGQTPRKWVYNQQGELIIAKNPRRRDALPIAISTDIRERVQAQSSAMRLEAIADLGELLDSGDWSRIVAARSVLQRMADGDKSPNVRAAAREALGSRAGTLEARAPAPPRRRQEGVTPPRDGEGAVASPPDADFRGEGTPQPVAGGEAAASLPEAPDPHATETQRRAADGEGTAEAKLREAATERGATPEPQLDDVLSVAFAALPWSKQITATAGRVSHQLSRLSLRGAWVAASAAALAVAGGINGGLFGAMLVATSGRVMAGAIEGALLALALASVMRRFEVRVRPVAWIGAVVLAEVVRWQIPIPGAPYSTTGAGLLIKGIADGLVIGFAQSLALELRGTLQKLWLGASVAGWVAAIFAFDAIVRAVLSTIMRAPLLPSILIGAAGGVAVGAATCVLAPSLARAKASEESRA